jgi:hypothetical protein
MTTAFDFEEFEREQFAAVTAALDAMRGATDEAAALVERGELLEANCSKKSNSNRAKSGKTRKKRRGPKIEALMISPLTYICKRSGTIFSLKMDYENQLP